MNRITEAEKVIAERLEKLDEETLQKLEDTAALDFDEHFAYQNAQAQAHAAGRLTTEEAQTVYMALGEAHSADNGGWADEADLATKITVCHLMVELL